MGCQYSSISDKEQHTVLDTSEHGLQDQHRIIVERSWQLVKLHIANVGVNMFVGMFESRPELIKVFSNFDSKDVSELRDSRLLHDHALRVMATVEAVISQLEDMPEVAKTLKEVGEVHRRYNVPHDLFQVILPHFLTAIRQHLDSSWSNDVEIAWTKLFDVIIFYLTDGDVI